MGGSGSLSPAQASASGKTIKSQSKTCLFQSPGWTPREFFVLCHLCALPAGLSCAPTWPARSTPAFTCTPRRSCPGAPWGIRVAQSTASSPSVCQIPTHPRVFRSPCWRMSTPCQIPLTSPRLLSAGIVTYNRGGRDQSPPQQPVPVGWQGRTISSVICVGGRTEAAFGLHPWDHP